MVIMIGLIGALLMLAYPSIRHFGFHFFVSGAWNPVTQDFGAVNVILDTLITAVLAVLITVPASFFTAIFIVRLLPPTVSTWFSRLIELMAAIPSIIYGIWGLFAFGPFLAGRVYPFLIGLFASVPVLNRVVTGLPIATTLLTASVILSFMIYPLITSMMRDVIGSIPPNLTEAAYSVGLTRWQMVRSIYVHYTRSGLLGSVVLGLGRALGETMAVTFVIGNAHGDFQGLLMPGSTIASSIANEFTEATSALYQSALVELALILLLISFITLFVSRYILSHQNTRGGTQ